MEVQNFPHLQVTRSEKKVVSVLVTECLCEMIHRSQSSSSSESGYIKPAPQLASFWQSAKRLRAMDTDLFSHPKSAFKHIDRIFSGSLACCNLFSPCYVINWHLRSPELPVQQLTWAAPTLHQIFPCKSILTDFAVLEGSDFKKKN